jgi:hypothetical protein
MATGIQNLYEISVLHRDVSLGNILLARDHSGEVYLEQARKRFSNHQFTQRDDLDTRIGGCLHDLDMAGSVVFPVKQKNVADMSVTELFGEMETQDAKVEDKFITVCALRICSYDHDHHANLILRVPQPICLCAYFSMVEIRSRMM